VSDLKLWISANYELISVVFGILAALGVLSAMLYRWYTVRAEAKKKEADYKRWVRDRLKDLDSRADRIDERQRADKERQDKQSNYAKLLDSKVDRGTVRSSQALAIAKTLRGWDEKDC
tara:strand:- start:982 stop:1335 length:354 start_codon:yes stop_codon:yes gene_type:complete